MTRNSKLLEEFTKYCEANPDFRFWQALRNWAGVKFLLFSDKLPEEGQQDTFYYEQKTD